MENFLFQLGRLVCPISIHWGRFWFGCTPTAGIVDSNSVDSGQQKEKVVSDLKPPTVAVPFLRSHLILFLVLISFLFSRIIFYQCNFSIAEKAAKF